MNTQKTKQIAYMPFFGVGSQDLMRLAAEKDAMVRKFCALREIPDEQENYISCRVTAALMRWDARNQRPQNWDAETLRGMLWRVCGYARLDFWRHQSARKRAGFMPKEDKPRKKFKIYFRGPRFFAM